MTGFESVRAWLHDPERVLLGTSQAIERARIRGAESIEPDDLMAVMLLAVSRFGIVILRDRVLDFRLLDLRFDLPGAEVAHNPPYQAAAAAVFDRAARVAREGGVTGADPSAGRARRTLGAHALEDRGALRCRAYGLAPLAGRHHTAPFVERRRRFSCRSARRSCEYRIRRLAHA